MKRVGIINFHCANNFGAVLQAYALLRTVLNLGYEAEIIDYRPIGIVYRYQGRINFKQVLIDNGFLRATEVVIKRLLTQRRRNTKEKYFAEMRDKFMILSKEKYFSSEELQGNPPKYDAYICGSDQVWNPIFKKRLGNSYFLDFVDDDSLKISYAASIAESVPENLVDEYIELINRIDFISVREKSAKDFLSSLIERKIHVVLDPTLLFDESDWTKLIIDKPVKYKYILVYNMVNNDKLIQVANELSLKTGFKIVSYSWINNSSYSFLYSSPGEFLSLIKGAELVLSSSFHGVAFSIVFNKPFLAFASNARSSRIVDFLKLLELEDRIVDEKTHIEGTEDCFINYEKAKKLLDIEKHKSINFLQNALSTLESSNSSSHYMH